MNDIMIVMLKALEGQFKEGSIENEIVLLSKDFLITEHNYTRDINGDSFDYEKLKQDVNKLENLRKIIKEKIKIYCSKLDGSSFSDKKNLDIIDSNVKDAIAFFLIQNIIRIYVNNNDVLTVVDDELICKDLDFNYLSYFIHQVPDYITPKFEESNLYYIECLKCYVYMIKQLSEVYKDSGFKGLLNIKKIDKFIEEESKNDNKKVNLFNILYDYNKLDLPLACKSAGYLKYCANINSIYDKDLANIIYYSNKYDTLGYLTSDKKDNFDFKDLTPILSLLQSLSSNDLLYRKTLGDITFGKRKIPLKEKEDVNNKKIYL